MDQNNQPSIVPQPEEIKISDYLRILLQYRYLIILIFVVVIAGTIIYTLRQPRIYSASGRILMENQNSGADILLLTNQGGGKNSINNQIELMRSKPILNAAYEIMKKNPDWESYPISGSAYPAISRRVWQSAL